MVYGVIPLVVWLGLIAMVLRPSHVTRPALRWVFILALPCCLASLWWIPLTRHTMHFIWVPAILAMWLSLISVVIRFCDLMYRWRKTVPHARRQRLTEFVRPVLIVLVMGVLWAREWAASAMIRDYSRELAEQVQATCDCQERCPRTLDGWTVIDENSTRCVSQRVVGRWGRQAVVRYESLISAQLFRIIVNYNGIAWFNFNGGVGEDLRGVQDGQ